MRIFNVLLCFVVLLCSIGCVSTKTIPVFDGNNAYNLLKEQCKFEERFSGGKDHKATIDYLTGQLKPNCDDFLLQNFTREVYGKKRDFTNIIGIINPKAENWVVLCSHYDNRPMCDQETDKRLQALPCPGANDGASSTAVLLEIAKQINKNKPDVGVVIALFDGEDYGKEIEDMLIGSTYFANNLKDIKTYKGKEKSIKYGILLDMIGDSDLNINIEGESNSVAPELVSAVWKNAELLGYEKSFIPNVKYSMSDDHIPLIENGINCIDIIDFDYKYWHKRSDTSYKCSPKSLKIVGDVVLKTLYSDFVF